MDTNTEQLSFVSTYMHQLPDKAVLEKFLMDEMEKDE